MPKLATEQPRTTSFRLWLSTDQIERINRVAEKLSIAPKTYAAVLLARAVASDEAALGIADKVGELVGQQLSDVLRVELESVTTMMEAEEDAKTS